MLDIKTKYIIIERSVKFDEPLQEVELVKEKSAEFPSYSTEYLDDEIGGDDPDLDPLIPRGKLFVSLVSFDYFFACYSLI